METIFGLPFFDGQSFAIIFSRFALNLASVFLLAFVYRVYSTKRDILFTFIAFNVPVFFLIYLMSFTEIGIGVGFGLFAIFTILRYRTQTVSLKDMSYLFLFISLGVINAVVAFGLTFIELLSFNLIIVVATWLLEQTIKQDNTQNFQITYDLIENLHPQNRTILLEDLKTRFGYDVIDVQILTLDAVKSVAKIQVVVAIEE